MKPLDISPYTAGSRVSMKIWVSKEGWSEGSDLASADYILTGVTGVDGDSETPPKKVNMFHVSKKLKTHMGADMVGSKKANTNTNSNTDTNAEQAEADQFGVDWTGSKENLGKWATVQTPVLPPVSSEGGTLQVVFSLTSRTGQEIMLVDDIKIYGLRPVQMLEGSGISGVAGGGGGGGETTGAQTELVAECSFEKAEGYSTHTPRLASEVYYYDHQSHTVDHKLHQHGSGANEPLVSIATHTVDHTQVDDDKHLVSNTYIVLSGWWVVGCTYTLVHVQMERAATDTD